MTTKDIRWIQRFNHFNSIGNTDVIEHIQRVGIMFYGAWSLFRSLLWEVPGTGYMIVTGRVPGTSVYTRTDDGIRVISFRKANKREVKKYERYAKS